MSEPSAEEKLVWEFFDCSPHGFFVEVGANHPQIGSQTWHLEQKGWRGILIEPQVDFVPMLRTERPGSTIVNAACSFPGADPVMLLHSPAENFSGRASLKKNVDDVDVVYLRTEKVKVTTLNQVVVDAGSPTIELLSIDVEGTELDVLRGLDLSQHRPALILIEDKCYSLDKHRYLRGHGYRLIRRTGFNNWYIPGERKFEGPNLLTRLKLFRKMYLGLPVRKCRRFFESLRRGKAANS
jgi:FkbM family methyltransferase